MKPRGATRTPVSLVHSESQVQEPAPSETTDSEEVAPLFLRRSSVWKEMKNKKEEEEYEKKCREARKQEALAKITRDQILSLLAHNKMVGCKVQG